MFGALFEEGALEERELELFCVVIALLQQVPAVIEADATGGHDEANCFLVALVDSFALASDPLSARLARVLTPFVRSERTLAELTALIARDSLVFEVHNAHTDALLYCLLLGALLFVRLAFRTLNDEFGSNSNTTKTVKVELFLLIQLALKAALEELGYSENAAQHRIIRSLYRQLLTGASALLIGSPGALMQFTVLGLQRNNSAFAEKYFQCISILASVLFVLYRGALVV